MTILDDIIEYKKSEVALAKASAPLSSLEALAGELSPPRKFADALRRQSLKGPALIGEIKKASPSKGVIRSEFNPSSHALAYEAGGAVCLSVLTDKPSFQGSPEAFMGVRAESSLPLLRKDFMIDPYQVAEARAWGADCILLIMACLSKEQTKELAGAAISLQMDILFETHNEAEMEKALICGAELVGINNRDLRTFQTSLETTIRLAGLAPKGTLIVSESGIRTPNDIALLRDNGADAFLVGESLMRADDIAAATRALISTSRTA